MPILSEECFFNNKIEYLLIGVIIMYLVVIVIV